MDVRAKFLGANRTVTGSKHLLDIDSFRLLIDCGLYQGLKMLRLRNWESFPVEPSSIDAIVLTHAHIDHTGYLPKLVKDGFNGPIYCTEATAHLAALLLRDSAKLQVEEAEYARHKGYSIHENPLPLYEEADVESVLPLFVTVDFDYLQSIHPSVQLKYYRAGHILGAAIAELTINGDKQTKKIVFSGDLGRYIDPLHPQPTAIKDTDILFVESTYAAKTPVYNDLAETIAAKINQALEKGGCVLIPAFAVGRTQEILYFLKKLIQQNRISGVKVYVDSPMAISATNLYKKYLRDNFPGNFEFDELFEFEQLTYCSTQEHSMMLNEIKSKAIIISASGMGTGGRILHHLYHRLRKENDTVLFIGFQSEGTRGRKLLDGEKEISVFGEVVPVNCNVDQVEGFSAHANRDELHKWVSNFKEAPKMTFIVHGEMEGSIAFKEYLKKEKGWNAMVPEYLESYKIFSGI